MKGMKTGGGQKGTPKKQTQDPIERLEELGCDPIEGMAKLAVDPNSSPDLKGRMYAELAQYMLPKPKAIEHVEVSDLDSLSCEEILDQIKALLVSNPELAKLIAGSIGDTTTATGRPQKPNAAESAPVVRLPNSLQ